MKSDAWRGSYDAWLSREPDYWDGEDEEGCTCPRTLGAGGHRKVSRDCPLHGIDPDDERDRRLDEDWRDLDRD